MSAPDLTLHNGEIATLAPQHPTVSAAAIEGGMAEWSPVAKYGGYDAPLYDRLRAEESSAHSHRHASRGHQRVRTLDALLNHAGGFFGLGCDCFAF
jgi:hypothetical protein